MAAAIKRPVKGVSKRHPKTGKIVMIDKTRSKRAKAAWRKRKVKKHTAATIKKIKAALKKAYASGKTKTGRKPLKRGRPKGSVAVKRKKK